MPYIPLADRPRYDYHIQELLKTFNANALNAPDGDVVDVGHLNYVFSQIVWRLWRQKPSYRHANDMLGILEAVKLEFVRRNLNEYEDTKIKVHGDLFATWLPGCPEE